MSTLHLVVTGSAKCSQHLSNILNSPEGDSSCKDNKCHHCKDNAIVSHSLHSDCGGTFEYGQFHMCFLDDQRSHYKETLLYLQLPKQTCCCGHLQKSLRAFG